MVSRVLVEDFMTLEEVSKIKGVSLPAIKRWVQRHPEKCDCRVVGNRLLVCRLSSFDQYKRRMG